MYVRMPVAFAVNEKSLSSANCCGIQVIDSSKNSIGCLAVLDMIIHASEGQSTDQRKVLDKIVEFLANFNPVDMRYVGQSLKTLLDQVASGELLPVGASTLLHHQAC